MRSSPPNQRLVFKSAHCNKCVVLRLLIPFVSSLPFWDRVRIARVVWSMDSHRHPGLPRRRLCASSLLDFEGFPTTNRLAEFD